MPVVGIVIAVAADAFAITAPTIFSVIGAVGATLGAVGAVTKDKTLSTIGMALGAVGGIGALATSVGAISDVSLANNSTFGDTVTSYGGAIQANTNADAAAAFNAANPAAAAVDTAAPTAADAVDEATGFGAAQPAAGLGAPAGAGAGAAAGAAGAAAGATGDPLGFVANSLGLNAPGLTPPTDTGTVGLSSLQTAGLGLNTSIVPGTSAVPPPVNGSGVMSDLMKFVQTPGGGNLAGMGLVAGASFLSSATNPLTPAQIAGYQAQAAANNATASLTNKQVSNINSGMPMAVTGAPAVTPVSGAPAPASTVSGAPLITPVSGKPIGLINQQAAAA